LVDWKQNLQVGGGCGSERRERRGGRRYKTRAGHFCPFKSKNMS